ncbi:MAG TPA: DUF2125 domain-containing protein [Stellaceae bacterium]|nr:DUF2125 domain-containing protein [Stellaceae bacterium]
MVKTLPSSRRLLLVAVALLLLAGGGMSALWFWSAHRIPAEIAAWAQRERQAGASVNWQSLSVGGFPLRLRVSLAGVTYGRSAGPPLYTATAPRLDGSAWIWNWGRWTISAPEGAALAVPASDLRPALDARAADVTGAVTVSGDGTDLAFTATGVAGSGFEAATTAVHLVLPAAPAGNHLESDGTLAVDVLHLSLPAEVPALGRVIDEVSARATLKGVIPAGPTPEALARWRDDGGTLELQLTRLVWGPLQANADGTLALDQQLQPEGAMRATIVGPGAIPDAMVASGAMRPNDGQLAKIALGLMSKPGANGTPQVTLPARVQNGNLYLGPARLLAMPRIAW